MSFNIYEGAQDPARYENIKTVVDAYQPQVVCLQEANGWHEGNRARLEDFAEDTGLTDVAFGNSNTASKLAIFSSCKILGFIVHRARFHHCAIQSWIESDEGVVEVVNMHNNPFSEDERLSEMMYLVPRIGRDAVLLGDMNSLSQQDQYPPSLWRTLQTLHIERYGSAEPRYDVTGFLALHGFIDVAAKRKANAPTFPAMTGLEAYQHPTRFDYVFAREQAEKAIEEIHVVTDPVTTETSDHHPVVFDIDVSALPIPTMPITTDEPKRAWQFAA